MFYFVNLWTLTFYLRINIDDYYYGRIRSQGDTIQTPSILLLFYCRCSYSILSYSLCHFTPPFFNTYKKCKKVYHIWPLALCKDTWLLYWKAGCLVDKTGSWPTTPLPRTVSNVPDKLNILQCLSRNWTVSMPRFSNRMLYLHCS